MLLHRLCVALGVIHPDHLQAQLSNPQIAEWLAYMRLEPFGPQYEAFCFARLQADVRNYSMASKKRDWTAGDFLPKPPEAPMTLAKKIRAGLGRAAKKRNPKPT